jgi:hypothetical protein
MDTGAQQAVTRKRAQGEMVQQQKAYNAFAIQTTVAQGKQQQQLQKKQQQGAASTTATSMGRDPAHKRK